jgi:hypothetical protein
LKALVWLTVAVVVTIVLGANAHLVYVSVTSQPDCVAHRVPGGQGEKGQGEKAASFSAAESACSPATGQTAATRQSK